MTRKIHQDLYVGLVIILISIFLYNKTFDLIEAAANYPRILLVLFLGFGIIILLSGIKKTKSLRKEERVEYSGDEQPLSFGMLKSPLVTLGIVVIYVFLLSIIGFFPATVLFMVVFLGFMKVKDWKTYIFTIGGLNLFIYLVFVMQLNVQLPKGIFFD
ncbi:tripartite tricarboxylate transporter TctB family protein [Bacillus sp. Marseille-Q3570]|uniref:tripartite tricarboxylate transporter TctB family protein n=1 Tax=Bacillales TaxID=1385 RepID=UPI0021B73A9C|nr:tripartite tricarboxylate transporter TctB family protein [Bacillus sp. Marseille-Q3570]